MTGKEAIAMLKRMQEPEVWEPQINEAAFEALEMAIKALEGEDNVPDTNVGDIISRQAAIDVLSFDEEMLRRVLDDMDVVGTEREKYS